MNRSLGYPNDRWGGGADGAGGFVAPAKVWPPENRRRDVLDACALA